MTEPTTTSVTQGDPARALEILARPFGDEMIRRCPIGSDTRSGG
jgi:hypothetical protein